MYWPPDDFVNIVSNECLNFTQCEVDCRNAADQVSLEDSFLDNKFTCFYFPEAGSNCCNLVNSHTSQIDTDASTVLLKTKYKFGKQL